MNLKNKKLLSKKNKKRKQKKREYNNACKTNRSDKTERLAEYMESQEELRTAIAEQNRMKTQKTTKKIIEEGGTKFQNFWKTRRKLLGSKADLNCDLITEEGEHVQNKEETKNYIAKYYENLY